jgi:hypothetical protein
VFEHEENGRFNVICIKYVFVLYQMLLVRFLSFSQMKRSVHITPYTSREM